ncbi:MAG TPA: hypothetical protein VK145_00980 [Candidatus Nanoarchaeia archaeon]|nr:hypothetical protein [Candidatus Nanoarchaeia archaeon]
MSYFAWASAILALALYVPLCLQIVKGTVKQNFTTWLLWATLDGIAAGTLIVQQGSYALPTAYTIGSLVTTLCIVRSKNFKWTWFESFVTVLVIACVIIWFSSGPKMATIVSSVALAVAGIPQLVESARNPWATPILIYFGYFVANVLALAGAKNWEIPERFYPSCAALFCIGIVILAATRRRYVARSNLTT